MEEEKNKKEAVENKLDEDLGDYWKKGPTEDSDEDLKIREDRKEEAICAGKKRSAKERLGTRKSHTTGHKISDRTKMRQDQDGSALEDMSIPQPGMPRTIPDLSLELTKFLLAKHMSVKEDELGVNSRAIENMEEENDDVLQDANDEYLGEELAARLCEPKTE